jgi:two-component system OmpR family sensor kinase
VSIGASLELERLPQVTVGDMPDEPLYLTITDDGPGIDPSFLPRAFEKYEKASFSSGTGLGLYAAQLMADAIDASLSISTSRLGTSLIIGLPRTGRLAGLAL